MCLILLFFALMSTQLFSSAINEIELTRLVRRSEQSNPEGSGTPEESKKESQEKVLNSKSRMEAWQLENIDVITSFIASGADVNMKNDYGNTLLMKAAAHNRLDIVQLLIYRNASLDIQNNDGMTALMIAVHNNRPAMVKFLVASGTNPNIINTKSGNKKAIDYAKQKNKDAMQKAICEGEKDFRYYQQQRKVLEEHIPDVLSNIVSHYTYEIPEEATPSFYTYQPRENQYRGNYSKKSKYSFAKKWRH
jgi:hypothetical protein